MTIKNNIPNKTALWVSLGSMVEYYDFVVYGMMAKYLGLVFFGSQNKYFGITQTFLIFAVGYFARPLGGVFFGIIGDRYGRKKSLLMLTSLMSVSTLSVGLLPSFEVIGIFSPILLALCRIAQGMSFGGELPGATTIVSESSSKKTQGWFSSFIIASTSLGAITANLILFLLTYFFTENQIMAWAWRVPFIIGGIAGIALFIGRYQLEETLKNQTPINPLHELIKYHYKIVIKGFFLTTFFAALLIANIYYPYYISYSFGYLASEIYFYTTISLIFSALILPVFGKISDFINKEKIIHIISFSYIIFCLPMFGLLYIRSTWALSLFLIFNQIFITSFAAVFFPVLTNLFPPKVRFTGVALCYNTMFALMALLPAFFTCLLEYKVTVLVVPIVLCFTALASLLSSKIVLKNIVSF